MVCFIEIKKSKVDNLIKVFLKSKPIVLLLLLKRQSVFEEQTNSSVIVIEKAKKG